MKNTENNFTFQRRLGENGKVQNPARIPPQTPPAGGTGAEAGGTNPYPQSNVLSCRVHLYFFIGIFRKIHSNFV